ncbi:MAG: PEP-utilizing enzyme [Candidatus Hodarchaeales archaeon]|jgi:phosphoenolpyruvate synthase/pyruvate phosphate dikinase
MGFPSELYLKTTLDGWSANSTRRSEGIAFVAHKPEEARSKLNSFQSKLSRILVCPLLDWSWSDIANKVSGIVTDHGTRVSRGSEVSGIVQVPAVLGTRVATKEIINGDYIYIICEGNEAKAKVYSRKII